MDNKIRYEDKASSAVAGKEGNHVREYRMKKQDHPNPQQEALLWPAARGAEARGAHTTAAVPPQPSNKGVLLPTKAKPFGAHEMNVHCLKTEGSKALRNQDGQGGHRDHMDASAWWNLTAFPPVLSPGDN